MLVLRHNSSLSDLDASALRLRSSYSSYNIIPPKQFTTSTSPSEEILPNYVHTTFPSQPPFSMYSSSQDQRDESLVDPPWLPSVAGPSAADVSHPADPSSALAPSTAVPKSTYSPSHTVVSTATTAFNDPSRHSRFLHTPGGSPSPRHQSFSSQQQHPGSLNRHLSEPNIRSAAAQPPPHYSLSNAPETRYQQQPLPQHRHSFQHSATPVLPSPSSASVSADRRPSTAGSAASSGWESIRAEPLQGITAATPTQGAHASWGSS